eukprot:jgi/Galph1/3703/GphlegSOOS_G2332.1
MYPSVDKDSSYCLIDLFQILIVCRPNNCFLSSHAIGTILYLKAFYGDMSGFDGREPMMEDEVVETKREQVHTKRKNFCATIEGPSCIGSFDNSCLLSFARKEMVSIKDRLYQLELPCLIGKMALLGTCLEYLKRFIYLLSDQLGILITDYRMVSSDVFRLTLDRCDLQNVSYGNAWKLVKNLYIILQTLSIISEDELGKHGLFPVFEFVFKFLNQPDVIEKSNIDEDITLRLSLSSFKKSFAAQLSSCQTTDMNILCSFINTVIVECGKTNKSFSTVAEFNYDLLESSLRCVRRLYLDEYIRPDTLLAGIELNELVQVIEKLDGVFCLTDFVPDAVTLKLKSLPCFCNVVTSSYDSMSILERMIQSWPLFFQLPSIGSKTADDDIVYRKFAHSAMKLCIFIYKYEMKQKENDDMKLGLLSQNLQHTIVACLLLGIEEDDAQGEYITEAVGILACLRCFSNMEVSVTYLKNIKCLSCMHKSSYSKFRSADLSFQCSGLSNVLAMLISEEFQECDCCVFAVWGTYLSYLLAFLWQHYELCDHSSSFHVECLAIILLDTLIIFCSQSYKDEQFYEIDAVIDIHKEDKTSPEEGERREAVIREDCYQVLYKISRKYGLKRVSCEKAVPSFLRLFTDRLVILGFNRLKADPEEIHFWQSLFGLTSEELWSIVCENVLKVLILRNDFESVDFIANKCQKSSKVLLNEHLGSVIGSYLYQCAFMNSSVESSDFSKLTHRLDSCLDFCRKIFDTSTSQIFLSCKISATRYLVQRLCRPYPEKGVLEKALELLAKTVGLDSSSSLVAESCLAVMDDINHKIFIRSRYSLLSRARSLKCLEHLFVLLAPKLHLFVPKILASLKLALELESALLPLCIQAWETFLNSLDSQHLGSHILSIFSILLPLLSSFPEKLGPPLLKLLMESSNEALLVLDETSFPDVLASQPIFLQFLQHLRTCKQRSSFIEQIYVLLNFIEHQEVAAVKHMALNRLHNLIKVHRSHIAKILSTDSKIASCVKSILHTLLSLFASSDVDSCYMASSIVGELGVVDPTLLGVDLNVSEFLVEQSSSSSALSDTENLELFIRNLLMNYLIPSLKKGEKSGFGIQQNVIGFALQELLRIYMSETASMCEAGSRLDSFFSSDLYLSLREEDRDLLVPYIHSSYSIVQTGHKKDIVFLSEIFRTEKVDAAALDVWISNMCVILVDSDMFSMLGLNVCRVFQACRNVYRIYHPVARYLFPYILYIVLSNMSMESLNSDLISFLDTELSAALEKGGIITSYIFSLMEKYRQIESLKDNLQNVSRNVFFKFFKSLRGLSLSKAAMNTRSYIHAIYYAEEYIHATANLSVEAKEAISLLQRCYNELDDKDALQGMLTLQKKKLGERLGLQEKILEAQARGSSDEANALFNEALSSKNVFGLEPSFVRNLLRLNLTEFAKFYAEKFSEYLQESIKEQMRALHCAAAWRLSLWSEIPTIDAFETVSEEDLGEVCIGTSLKTVVSYSKENFQRAMADAQRKVMSNVAKLSLESYRKAYKSCVYFSILREIEWIVELFTQTWTHQHSEKLEALNEELLQRLKLMIPDIAIQEQTVEARRVCFDLFNQKWYAAQAILELAKLQKETGNLNAAYLNIVRSENISYMLETNANSSLLTIIEMEKADVYKKKGNLLGSLETLQYSIQRLEKNVDLDSSFNSHEVNLQLAQALVFFANVSESSQTCTSEIIASYYRRAVEIAPNYEEGFYFLARFYDRIIQEARRSNLISKEDQIDTLPGNTLLQSTSTASCSDIMFPYFNYLTRTIENYARTLELSPKHIFESLPRLLTLWFDFEENNCVYKNVESIAMVESKVAEIRGAIERAFDTLPLWQFTTCILQILSRLTHPSSFVRTKLIHLTAKITATYTKHIIWYLAPVINGKNSVRRKASEKIVAMAEKLGDKIVKNSIHYGFEFIKELSEVCLKSAPKNAKKLYFTTSFARFKKLLPCTHVLIPSKRAMMMSDAELFRKNLPNSKYVESIEFSNVELPSIEGVEEEIILMNSLMKPKRISLLGSDGKHYAFLCKREDSGDMRKDSRLMEFASVVNRLLRNHYQSRVRHLSLRTYTVLPLSEECGVIEWLSNLAPLRGIVFHLYRVFGIPISLAEIKENYETRTRFTYSCAVWSMIGHIIGLGDRHGENILIDMTSGECIHVDFACMFDKGLTLKVPEVVPFRLTQNILDAMGPTGYEGLYRIGSEITMSIAREHRDGLMSVLETFLHDPLVEWERTGGGKYRSNRGKESTSMGENKCLERNNHALKARKSVDQKLQGIVTGSGLPLSVEGQVERLISEAIDEENLSNMYIWWMAWI